MEKNFVYKPIINLRLHHRRAHISVRCNGNRTRTFPLVQNQEHLMSLITVLGIPPAIRKY